MRNKLFISYRRDDAKAEARSIYQHMAQAFGADRLFMDVDSIQKGLDFGEVLETTLRQTAVMIVVMGRTWLTATDESGRRKLDEPADYVHMEIATALANALPVIPVRVDGARLPRSEELPAALRSLTRRQGTVVTHENFDSDIHGLEADVRRFLGDQGGGPNSRRGRAGLIAVGVALLAAVGAGAFYWLNTPFRTPPAATKTASAAGQSAADTARAAAAWAEARRKNTFEEYREYLRTYPSGGHRREAADAAVAALQLRLDEMVAARLPALKTAAGAAPQYMQHSTPRALALCIDWASSSHAVLTAPGWGSYAQSPAWKGPAAETDERALAQCNAPRKETDRCQCTIAHRDGVSVLRAPVEWVARQLR